MFEDYLEDAHFFLEQAQSSFNDEKLAKRFYRVSIFCAANAMEAFLNYVGDTLSKGAPLEAHELAFLNDKKFVFELNKPDLLVQKKEYHALEDKLGMLIKKFLQNFNFKVEQDWENISKFKKIRDDLVHSRQVEDETSLSHYDETVKKSLKSIIIIMDKLYQAMYRSSLRQKLLDLIPD
jgi:hypothetical protein